MKRAILLAGLLAGCSSEPESPNAADPVVTMVLPADTVTLPATPAGERVTDACTACHSAEMIRQQPKMDAEKWAATVRKMREAYHAPIGPGDDAALVSALVELQRE